MSMEEPSYILCDTYECASQAATELSSCPTLILDCEGYDIGMPDGSLSIIAIGDSTASKVFIFDVLALPDKTDTLLTPLLDILRRPDITKVMWDGRADFTEIAEAYGVRLEGVLDLQLVEVVQRGRRKRKGSHRESHTADYFKNIKDELAAEPAALEGIHRVYGLERCAGLYRLIKKGEGKDIAPTGEVVALHATDAWMHRPLPPALLEYSAHDIQLIAKMFARFQKKGHYLDDVEASKEISARYMEVYTTRDMRAKHVELQLCKFVPLEVLAPPLDGAPKFKCARCERVLSLPCFVMPETVKTEEAEDAASSGGPDLQGEARDWRVASQRLTFCRLCHLIARRNSEVVLGERVDIFL